jgi:hypothetical protein
MCAGGALDVLALSLARAVHPRLDLGDILRTPDESAQVRLPHEARIAAEKAARRAAQE